MTTLKKDIIDGLHLLDSLSQWDDNDLGPYADKIIEIFENVVDKLEPAQGMEYHCQLAVNYAKSIIKGKLYEPYFYDDGTFTTYKNNRTSHICKLCHRFVNTNSKENIDNFVCDGCNEKLRKELKSSD